MIVKEKEVEGTWLPQKEFTPIPFWFWNDELKKEEILRQMEEMKDKGVDGFVIHPRIGLPETMEYMGNDYLEYVKFAVEKAQQMNMKVILYDEGMYPSGSANGQVVKSNPDFASQGLCMRKEQSKDKEGRLIYEDGEHYFYLVKSEGTIRGIHFGEDDGEINVPKSADLLNPLAVECFIKLTHEKYYKVLKEYFGTTVAAIFTDEPSILGRNAKEGLIPWTFDFLEYYLGHGGKKEELSLLFDAKDSAAKRKYENIVGQRLIESYYRPLRAWCDKHGVKLTGHPHKSDDIGMLAEFGIPAQDVVFRMFAPGDDSCVVGEDSTMGKCSSDSARHRGKRRNGNECLGCCSLPETPYTFTREDMKWYLDWLFVRGVNLIIPHAFFYSIEGKRKAERPPDVGLHSEFWEEYHQISDYIKRMCWLMTDCVNQAKVAVICRSNQLPHKIVRPLFENQLEFNYLEEDLLGKCEVEGGKVRIAKQRYEAIVLDRDFFYNEETYCIVKEWEALHIPIIWMDDKEKFVYEKLLRYVTPDLRVKEKQPYLRMTHIKKDGKDFVLLTNEGETDIETEIRFAFGKIAEIWDAEEGTKEKTPWLEDTMALRLGRRKSMVVVIKNDARY